MQWYSLHHPVKHQHKLGKVRRVCNAASKFKGVSLNDKLLTGPDLLKGLIGIIFRFRAHEIAITAHMESTFLQVAVPKGECKVFRFFSWCDRTVDEIRIYEYNRHVFGATSSPTCANEDRAESNEFFLPGESSSILGLEWKINEDFLKVCRSPNKDCPAEITQRVVLSLVSSVFDQQDTFVPFTMRMQILLKST